jgi:hypothetical protein
VSTEDDLAYLHDLVVGGLTKDLQDAEKRTPAHYKAAMELLKHNKISALSNPGSQLSKLAETLEGLSDASGEFLSQSDIENVIQLRKRV